MKNVTTGCLGIILIMIVLSVVAKAVAWVFINIVGLIGGVLLISGIVTLIKNKRLKYTQWPITGLVSGIVLTFVWIVFKNWMNTVGLIFFLLFLGFIITYNILESREK